MADSKNSQSTGSFQPKKSINSVNGHSVVARRRTPQAKSRPGSFARIFSIALRLAVWYSIYTLLFRCPASLEACDETSPKICKPYFQAKHAVTPHVAPYYESYAAPYVELARPYYDTVDRNVLTPMCTYAVKYGSPQLEKAQAIALAQWEKNVQPQLIKYQAQAKTQYDRSIAPHVDKVSTAVAPYYNIAKTSALQKYHGVLMPSYLYVQPYAVQGYEAASKFTTETAVPSTVWAWNKTYVFLDSTVWPHLRDVYILKVEPQLVRIGERLGRYKEKKLKSSVVEESDPQTAKSTFAKPTASSSSTTATVSSTVEPEPTASSVEANTQSSNVEVEASEESEKPTREQIVEAAAQTVAEDLELWQGKFTKAADEGAVEIENRVEELSSDMIAKQVDGKGRKLIGEFEKTIKTEISSLKQTLLAIITENKDSEPASLEKEVAAAVRSAGLTIKDKAQGIRSWRQTYEQEIETNVTNLAAEHIKILESIRDLALQRIGMKWAWMDGITYKDWQKFHQLRERLDEWTEDLKRLIVTHPALERAQKAGIEVEDFGMGIAGEAAQQLASLKQVAMWKAIAGDYSDDFDASSTKLAAEAAQRKVAEAAEALNDMADGVQEGVHSIADGAQKHVGSISEAVADGVSDVTSSATEDTVTVSLSEVDTDTHTSAVPPLENMASEPVESASDLASEPVQAETPVMAQNSTSAANPVDLLPTSEPVDGPEQVEETIVASPDEPSSSAGSSATAIKSAMFGAAAQSAPSRQPIFDDDTGSSMSSTMSGIQSDVPHSITVAAQSAYTAAIAQAADQYSRAMSAVSVQISGEPKPMHEEMLSSVSSAYFAAMASANSGYAAAALPTVPSVPSFDWEKIQSVAQQNLQDGVNWAGAQYESAKVAIGAAEPTPSTASERAQKMLDQAKHNYYAGLGLAHARYSEFINAASSAASSITATPTPTNVQESASSMASVAGESASSVAATASEAASSAVSAVGESVSENWEFLVNKVSSQVYAAPTPTPWYENFYVAAGDYASQAGDSAASAAAQASEYAGSATSAGSSQYSVVSSLLSELIVGKEPTFTESVYSRLAGAYGVATATIASVASEASESATSVASVAAGTASAATAKVKDTAEHIIDEL